MYSLRIVSILFSDKGFMDDRVAGIAIAWRARPISFIAGYRPRFLVT